MIASSPALWGLLVSIISKMSEWIQKGWARDQRSEEGCSFSAATTLLNWSASSHLRNSSTVGTYSSPPSVFKFLEALGSPRLLPVLSTFKYLNGDDRRVPEIPTTPSVFPNSPKLKQWWTHLTRFPPAGMSRKFPLL